MKKYQLPKIKSVISFCFSLIVGGLIVFGANQTNGDAWNSSTRKKTL